MNSRHQERYGTVEQRDDGRWQLRFTRTLPHPQEKVWRAITEPEQLAHWVATKIQGERAPGARLILTLPEGKAPPMEGDVLDWAPPSQTQLRRGCHTLR